MLLEDRELTERAARIEALLDEIESFPDPAMRARVAAIVQGLLALYGEGLRRMLDIVEQQSAADVAATLLDAFAGDELISHLLLLHDLHPVDVESDGDGWTALFTNSDLSDYLNIHISTPSGQLLAYGTAPARH